MQLSGKDVSGNRAGAIDYRITFEVINKAMISNVMNYPNPFTSQTKFVFTLTGSEVPDYFKIQIMTVSGKVIREIMRDELGSYISEIILQILPGMERISLAINSLTDYICIVLLQNSQVSR